MTISRPLRLIAALLFAALLGTPADAGELPPYRARYALTLATTQASSGVVAAGGADFDELAETCGGWAEQEHFYLHLDYGEKDEDRERDSYDTYSNLVTWEAKDGSSFRFDLRRASSDEPYAEIKGEARLSGPGLGGKVAFTQPRAVTLPLAPGTLFPAAHTRLLIERAQAGDHFLARDVFDGSDVEKAVPVTAFIGPKHAPGTAGEDSKLPQSPLLKRPSWQIRLAFFPAGHADATPDYEETLLLLDNGVVKDMVLDYGDYKIHARLEQIEALPRPRC